MSAPPGRKNQTGVDNRNKVCWQLGTAYKYSLTIPAMCINLTTSAELPITRIWSVIDSFAAFSLSFTYHNSPALALFYITWSSNQKIIILLQLFFQWLHYYRLPCFNYMITYTPIRVTLSFHVDVYYEVTSHLRKLWVLHLSNPSIGFCWNRRLGFTHSAFTTSINDINNDHTVLH